MSKSIKLKEDTFWDSTAITHNKTPLSEVLDEDIVGIESITQTTTSTADSGENIITIKLTNSTSNTFKVKNGSKGTKGDKGDTGTINYPVGGIYLSVNNTNPSTYFGGTWELVAKGRTLVGVDTSDTDFNTVKKTGGSKTISYTPSGTVGNHTLTISEIPAHNHNTATVGADGAGSDKGYVWGLNISNWGVQATGNAGGSSPHNHGFTGTAATLNNVQPYFTCYIWCRTA